MKKIYTKKESMENIPKVLLIFVISLISYVWFLMKNNAGHGAWIGYGMFAIMIWSLIYWMWYQATKWRRHHRECVAANVPQNGIITDCICETKVWRSSKRTVKEHNFYLMVKVDSPWSSEPMVIKSDAYTGPVYQLLSSPEVQVYRSNTESGYILDGFQYKKRLSEPDVLPEGLRHEFPLSYQSKVVPIILMILFGMCALAIFLCQ